MQELLVERLSRFDYIRKDQKEKFTLLRRAPRDHQPAGNSYQNVVFVPRMTPVND
jgi:hypothetical protein